MGEMYGAPDTRLDRTVADELLPALLAADRQLRARLEREATAVSSLTHPHICTIHEVGQETVGGADLHYLALSPVRLETVPATTVFLNWTAGLRWLQACRP